MPLTQTLVHPILQNVFLPGPCNETGWDEVKQSLLRDEGSALTVADLAENISARADAPTGRADIDVNSSRVHVLFHSRRPEVGRSEGADQNKALKACH